MLESKRPAALPPVDLTFAADGAAGFNRDDHQRRRIASLTRQVESLTKQRDHAWKVCGALAQLAAGWEEPLLALDLAETAIDIETGRAALTPDKLVRLLKETQ